MGGETLLGHRYRLVDRLGMGGMGVVWRAYDEVLDRQVAVKVLVPEYAGDADSRRRVLVEARAAARLTHPHIASVYDYGESVTDDGSLVPYVVMELLHGRSLAQRLKRGPLSVELALGLCAEVASALAAGHAQGLVHRDVKPENVMLTPAGAKVVDFGLAAAAGDRDSADGTILVGTPAYLAPERLSGHPVVAATDVYALGLLLYRLLAGRLPWTAETTTQMLEAHVYLEPAPLPKLAGVPPVITDLVNRCLAKEPAQRPPSSELTVTLAHVAGIRVPLDGLSDDDLDDGDTDGRPSSSGAAKGGVSGSGGKAVVRPDLLAALPARASFAGDPYVVRLGKYLDASLNHVDLRRQASLLLHGAVGFDLAVWAVLDPITLMWASCVIDGGPYDERFERELFANEYGHDDVLRLVDLADGARLGSLRVSTKGDPSASRRYRAILEPRGFSDELRQTFFDTAGTWGALFLYRTGGQFTDVDMAHLAPAGRPLGAALHHALVRRDPVSEPAEPTVSLAMPGSGGSGGQSLPTPEPQSARGRRRDRRSSDSPAAAAGPVSAVTPPPASKKPVAGTLTISNDGRFLDVTANARALLDAAELDKVGRAVAGGRMSGLIDTSGGRHDGRWLAFCAVKRPTALAVTVQRIRPNQASEFVARAYGLEPFRWQLLGALARGRNTRQTAHDLRVSVYAVQDGMKSLFTAFGVHDRIALMKTLFFDHYVPLHAADSVVTPET